jgi:iron complex outermembrane recepter protein
VVRRSAYVLLLAVFGVTTGTKTVQARALDLDRPVAFNIRAQRVGSALIQFSQQADIQVLIAPMADSTAETPPIHKTIPARVALDILLRHSGLTYSTVGGAVSITRANVPPAPSDTGGADSTTAVSSNSDRPTSDVGSATAVTEQPTRIEQVVVTAQKREERLQDVPISISVLSGGVLDKATGAGLYDQLNQVPGVVIPPIIGPSQISIRGVGADGASWVGASPVAYYLDTVPFGFVRTAYIPDTGSFDLARVEVLRGPQGTLYGSNAEDGVVRLITHDADPSGFDLKARIFGSDTDLGGANGGGDVAVNVPLIENKLAVRGVVSYKDMSGWIDRPAEENANHAVLRDYRLKLAYHPTDALSIDLSLWNSRHHFNAPSTGRANGTAPDTGTTPEPADSNFDAYGARIRYQSAHFAITSMTSYLYYGSFFTESPLPYGDFFPSIGVLSLSVYDKSYVFSEEVLLNSTDTGPWRWSGGVFYRDEHDLNWQNSSPQPVGYVNFKDASRSFAVFGELGRRFLDNKLEWTLGLRQFHDQVSTLSLDPTVTSYVAESFNSTTPRAVLTWYPSDYMTVYSSFSEGFRSGMPQFYTVTEIAPTIPALRPDKLYNYEFGAKADLFDHHLAIDTSVYYVKWRGVQQSILVPWPATGYLTAQVNASNASGPGVDIGITVSPTQRAKVGGTFSWNDLTVDSQVSSGGFVLYNKGDRLNNSSKYTASLFASYTFPFGGDTSGELSASANYQSRQAVHGFDGMGLPYVNYGDNLFFVQAAFSVTFGANWSMRLYGDNLTNESGSIIGPVPGWAPSIDELLGRPRPRTIGLELNYRYR